MIGDEVIITVLGVKGNQVRLGIKAPKHVAVHRQEVYELVHGAEAAQKLLGAIPAREGHSK